MNRKRKRAPASPPKTVVPPPTPLLPGEIALGTCALCRKNFDLGDVRYNAPRPTTTNPANVDLLCAGCVAGLQRIFDEAPEPARLWLTESDHVDDPIRQIVQSAKSPLLATQ